MSEPVLEYFLRYAKVPKSFEFRVMADGKQIGETVTFDDAAVGKMRAIMKNPKELELFDFLLLEAKKDPEEKFVSASSVPVKEGQATLG